MSLAIVTQISTTTKNITTTKVLIYRAYNEESTKVKMTHGNNSKNIK